MTLVTLFDVDNTLLDNDRVAADLRRHLGSAVGEDCGSDYWAYFEELRAELGYADYLGALQRYRSARPRDLRILAISHFLLAYPFAERLYPEALAAIEHCAGLGEVVVLSDGDVVFQPHKIRGAGIDDAVGGNVLVYIHKELELDDVADRFPSDHYLLVDDKMRILAAVKQVWGERVTTVWPRQGHYALDEDDVARYPAADVALDRIGDLTAWSADALIAASR